MSKNQPNVFIIEDNNVFRMALKADIENTFTEKNIKIHLFETGEACKEQFKKVQPEVVILDYNLNSKIPNAINGIKVLGWIKKSNPETSVIMLTSEDDIDIALKSFHHGASDYVVKSETKFKKINYSLLNIFNTISAKSEAKKYRAMAIILSLSITLLIGGIVTIQYLEPNLLK